MKLLKAATFMTILLLNALITLGIMSMRVQPVRGGEAGATMNGDVNCDGKINISDAISIIQYQFNGGPEPCALAQDNFATKEDVAAIASRVATLEGKKFAASGRYTGDGKYPRRFPTNLTGKLHEVQIYYKGGEFTNDWSHQQEPRLRLAADNLTSNGIVLEGSDFIIQDSAYRQNDTGGLYGWVAVSVPE